MTEWGRGFSSKVKLYAYASVIVALDKLAQPQGLSLHNGLDLQKEPSWSHQSVINSSMNTIL